MFSLSMYKCDDFTRTYMKLMLTFHLKTQGLILRNYNQRIRL